jgi:hypothetical protein
VLLAAGMSGYGMGYAIYYHYTTYTRLLYPGFLMTRRLYRAKLGKKRFTVNVNLHLVPHGTAWTDKQSFLLPMVRLSVAAVAEDRVRAGEASGSWTPFFHQCPVQNYT